MSFRARLLLFGYPLLEVVTAYLVALWIGWGWMLLLILLGFPIGFALMRNAGDAALRDMQEAASTGKEPDAGRHTLGFLGGLLVMIPGFWSDLVGLLLVFPPTQRLFRRWSSDRLNARMGSMRVPGARYPSGDVIQGTVVQRPSDSTPGQPPQDPPTITAG